MKKERKEALLRCFPSLTANLAERLKGKGAKNFVVMLTHGNELFARCYHRYCNGNIVERQRYVFAQDGCCRYGSEDGVSWTIRTEFREPVFCSASYGYTFDNSYTVLNFNAVKQSCMRYSGVKNYGGSLLMEYMRLYCRHPNIEYLMKSGYDALISEVVTGYWGGITKLEVSRRINWKSNNLLKMLGLNRTEFKLLKGSERYYEAYSQWREKYPGFKPAELLTIARVFQCRIGTVESLMKLTDVRLPRIAEYLSGGDIIDLDYLDYLQQCRDLEYNTSDTAICMPHDFNAMHTRLSQIVKYRQSEEARRIFKENYPLRKALEFSSGNYLIRQPESMDEIIAEGAALKHCVGGYAERHARGKLNILFIRRADKPDEPYFTIELSNGGDIVQVRGLRNCSPPKSVQKFIEQYKQHIANVFRKARKTA